MSFDDFSHSLSRRWAEFSTASSDDLPMPMEHPGWTRQEYWAQYRKVKHQRWLAMYGKFRVPWVDEKEFATKLDAHYVRLIALSILSLPTVHPAPIVPRLRRASYNIPRP